MTLRKILSWWRQDLIDWWQTRSPKPTNDRVWKREGRMIAFVRGGGAGHYPGYTIYARRGGFCLGRLDFRNQWGYYAFYPADQREATPMNKEIIAEIYAMLKELQS